LDRRSNDFGDRSSDFGDRIGDFGDRSRDFVGCIRDFVEPAARSGRLTAGQNLSSLGAPWDRESA
jgi:hypothetical protein